MKKLLAIVLAFTLFISQFMIKVNAYTTNYAPIGCVDVVTASVGSITVGGWTYDKDSPATSIQYQVYAGSTLLGTYTANTSRPDVNSAYGITGNHGFITAISTTLTGSQTITIKAVDLTTNTLYTIGSKTVTIPSSSAYTTNYNPKGNVEAVTATAGSIKIAGWAYDPDDASQSISVKAYIGSTCLGTVSANIARADVNSAFSISGKHGFSGTLSTTLSGTQTVTIKIVDLGSEVEHTIGSKSVTIPSTTNNNPIGNVEAVTATAGSIKIAGWAYDPDDASQSISVKAYIGSTCLGTVSANITRTDVNSAFSISGRHGFSGKLSTTLQGTQTVTVKAIDVNTGSEYTIGSKSVTIPSTTNNNPKGNVEAITATAGSIKIGGWAYDPDDASQSISVKAYIGTICLGSLSANIARSDVNSAFSISGNHGFSGKLSTPLQGTQTVTIKAVDTNTGSEHTIGSKSVTIPSSYTTKANPIGNVESVSATLGSITIGGWAYDPDDASQSISIKAYIGSTYLGTINTNIARSDVNSKFSISGNHGFSGKLSTTLTGTQTVTIKAVDLGSGAEYAIGYKSVTIPAPITTNYDPKGNVESIKKTTDGKVYAGGWAYDPDSPSSNIVINMYVGNTLVGSGTTSYTRSDVNNTFSITGTHGFNLSFTTTLTGIQTVTIKAVDLSTSKEVTLASQELVITDDSIIHYSSYSNSQWNSTVTNTQTTGDLKNSLTAYKVSLSEGSITYSSYIANTGWQSAVSTGNVSGTYTTNGIEAIKMELGDDLSSQYDLYYRVYLLGIGWLGYAKNGEMAGTTGCATSIKGIQIRLLKKGSAAPESTLPCNITEDSAYFIAHRGYSAVAPENTVASFTLAGQNKFWGCETDIWVTSDGQFACMHDPNISRMTGKTGKIRDYTLAQLQTIKITNGNNVGVYNNQYIPSLQQYLNVCKTYNMVPFIEIKDGPYAGGTLLTTAQLTTLYKTVKSIMGNSKVFYIAFDLDNLINLRSVLNSYGDTTTSLDYVVYDTSSVNINTLKSYNIGIDINYNYATESVVTKFKNAGIQVGVFTLDSLSNTITFVSEDVLYITSNSKYWE